MSKFRSRKGSGSSATDQSRPTLTISSTATKGSIRGYKAQEKDHSTFRFAGAFGRLPKTVAVSLVFCGGFATALLLIALLVSNTTSLTQSTPPILSRGKSAAYTLPLVDANELEPIETFGTKPQRDWFGRLHKKQTGFVRTKAVSKWLRDLFRFEDSGPPYDSVNCRTSFGGQIAFGKGEGQEFNEAILRFLNKHSLHNAKAQHKYAVRSKIDEHTNGGVPKLNGQFGIMSKTDLKKYQCVGQYMGDEMFVDEFNSIYEWNAVEKESYFARKWFYYLTIEEEWHLPAAMELHRSDEDLIAAKVDTSNDTLLRKALAQRYGANRTFTVDAYFNHKTELEKSHIQRRFEDGEQLQSPLVAFINDARADMSSSNLTDTDKNKRLNVEFVDCAINDKAMFAFLVVLKDVAKGQQLFNYYGPGYTL